MRPGARGSACGLGSRLAQVARDAVDRHLAWVGQLVATGIRLPAPRRGSLLPHAPPELLDHRVPPRTAREHFADPLDRLLQQELEAEQLILDGGARAEVGAVEGSHTEAPQASQALSPSLSIELGRRGGQIDEAATGEADPRDIAAERHLSHAIHMVMPSVTGCFDGRDAHACGFDRGPVSDCEHTVARRREHLAPQGPHAIAVDPRSAGQEFPRIDQVRGADRVDPDSGALTGPPACRPGVVQMDVRDQHVLHVGGADVVLGKTREQRGQRRRRAGFDQQGSARAADQERGDDVRHSLKLEVEDVDLHFSPHGSLSRVSQEYDPRSIEPRWQRFWLEHHSFAAANPGEPGFDPSQPKFYVLDMFPYPSGAGLHVGHPVGYIGSDIVARRKRMEGFNVLHPMGWDAFGLPAEQYAIQTGKHPAQTTAENVLNFRRQLRLIGLSYDWNREINTSSPEYYRWTQWLFARLYDRGLVYRNEVPVWWCEELKTVLANEEVIDGRSERGNYPCVRRPLKQWMLRITAYADRLLDDLETVDWPDSIQAMQREWIGRSTGAEIDFPLIGLEPDVLTVFTTRPDTLWGATFLVVAPEHLLLGRLTAQARRAGVAAYVERAALKSDLERTDLARDKSGVPTGGFALNPVLEPDDPRARLPIFVADYVLQSYGTGAIMAVPGHDERDLAFAQQHGLPILEVVRPPRGTPGLRDGGCFTGLGTAIHSGPIDGLTSAEAIRETIRLLEGIRRGRARITYKLRDWIFSRQRYWGEPFPLLHLEDGTVRRVRDLDLPVELPEMSDFSPAPDGSPPLARALKWVTTVDPESGSPARRDTDTMPGWAGSCWYWLRFMDPHNERAPFSAEAERYWGPVDLYVGGASHAVLHLLYSRFWHKVLFDLGLVREPEPFRKLFNQGILTAPAYRDETRRLLPANEVEPSGDGFVHRPTGKPVQQIVANMSKSLRNVVNPDDVIAEYGADTFRLYEMFMAPLADSRMWDPRGISGCRRFLDRLWRVFVDPAAGEPIRPELHEERPRASWPAETLELERALNRMLRRVEDSFEQLKFNTAVAAMMTFLNETAKHPGALTRGQAERWLLALAPFAPHVAEELWERLGHETSIGRARWFEVDPALLEDDEFELVVQVQGKVRARARASRAADSEELAALARRAVAPQLEGKELLQTVVVPGRLVNFVVR